MTAKVHIDLLAKTLYTRHNTAMKWLEQPWELLPEATRTVWLGTVTLPMLERLEDEAKLAYIRYSQAEVSTALPYVAWESLGSLERRRWRAVVARFTQWRDA